MSAKDRLISQELLRGLFDYDPDTGVLTHKVREGANSKSFNTQLAGRPAGTCQNSGYTQVSIKTKEGRKLYLAHRVIFMLVYGYVPDEVDHVNRVRTDNRLTNLREATHSQNQANKPTTRTAKSGLRGLWYVEGRDLWRVQCNRKGKTKTVGYFKTKKEAAEVYNSFAVAEFGEFAVLNQLEGL